MSQTFQIHDRLRDMILLLDFRPGERLSERWLESRFDGSRTPIRTALLRLEAEELVQRDGRNWIVAPIDLAEIAALSEFREAVESAAVRFTCAGATPEDIDALTALLDACPPDATPEDWHRTGADFHIALARLSGNRFLVRSTVDAMTRLSRARWLEIRSQSAREQAWTEHRAIVDLIRRNQPDEAVEHICRHIRETRDRLLRSLSAERRDLRTRGFAVVG